MTVLFAGTELMDFETIGGTVTEGGNTSAVINTSNSRIAISPGGTVTEDLNYIDAVFSATEDDVWLHFSAGMGASPASTIPFCKVYSGGTQRVALRWNTSNVIQVQTWNGSSWTTVLTTPINTLQNSTRYDIDLHLVVGNPGKAALYVNGAVVAADAALDLSFGGISGFDKARFQVTSSGTGSVQFSEVIAADWNTIGAKIVSKAPDANGNYTAWTGAFGDIDETSGGSDVISGASNGDRESFSLADFPALTGSQAIAAVGVGWIGLRDASGPQNINAFTRISSTDYDGADRTLNTAATPRQKIWETSPATSVAWTIAEINGAEFGFRART